MFVTFDREAEVTSSHLTIEPLTLLTRVGGIIGVGKEFLWIIITLFTYLATFSSQITRVIKVG